MKAIIIVTALACIAASGANVTVSTNVRYQTIIGYGCATHLPPQNTPELRQEVFEELANEFGVNRMRLEPPGQNTTTERRWEWLNDDGDPEHINWGGLNTARLDEVVMTYILPLKAAVEANGEKFNLYVSPSFYDGGSSGAAPAWQRYSVGECCEYAMSLLLYLRDRHGVTADYYCVLNEPSNNNPWTAPVIQPIIKALAPMMAAAGLPTRIEYPESISIDTGWNSFVNASSVRDDTQMWSHVGILTWHLYGGQGSRANMRNYAVARGIPTGQTEYMSLTTTHLYDEMTVGDVSVWEIYGIGSQLDTSGANYNRFVRTGWYWPFRQVLHYARPGSVRVGTTCDDSQLRVIAFVRGGRSVVALINDLDSTARTANLSGLVPGSYGVCRSVNKGTYAELGLQTVGTNGLLSVDVPGNAVLTVYPHPGSNMPPVAVDWKASNAYLTQPSSSTTLSAAARDPELDSISYVWSVKTNPPGASVNLATPNAASCGASGLTVAGRYAFNVAISDPTHTINREVRIDVYAGNRPPAVELHNRIPVLLTLPQSSTTLRAFAWDMEGAGVAYQWSVASQPGGAAAQLSAPSSANSDVSGMTVAGEYVFRCTATAGGQTVTNELVVPVYPADQAPVISNAVASPATLYMPESATQLAAVTADADGDVLSHWWTVKTAPSGTNVVFSRPGSNCTMVAGLTAPGTYTFTLTLVDRNAYATRDVSVNVLLPEPAMVVGVVCMLALRRAGARC